VASRPAQKEIGRPSISPASRCTSRGRNCQARLSEWANGTETEPWGKAFAIRQMRSQCSRIDSRNAEIAGSGLHLIRRPICRCSPETSIKSKDFRHQWSAPSSPIARLYLGIAIALSLVRTRSKRRNPNERDDQTSRIHQLSQA
jgi:hypothetical protein